MKGILPPAHHTRRQMAATLQIDYVYALNRAGVLNREGRVTLFAKQRVHSYDDINEYLQSLSTTNGPTGIWLWCLDLFDTVKENYEDEFKVILLSFDLVKNVRPVRGTPVSTDVNLSRGIQYWGDFLGQYDLLEFDKEAQKTIAFHIFYSGSMTAHQKFELWKKWVAGREDYKEMYSDYFVAGMVRKINKIWPALEYVSLPLAETESNMGLLLEWEKEYPGLLTNRFGQLSMTVDMDYVEKNMHLPWNHDNLLCRQDLRSGVLNHPALQYRFRNDFHIVEYTDIAISRIITNESFTSDILTGRFLQRSIRNVGQDSIWRVMSCLYNNITRTQRFARHSVAGVIQRVWRRHRERVRRKKFAETYLDEDRSRLATLPRDLQWMVYRFVRPVGVLRGLPPKFH